MNILQFSILKNAGCAGGCKFCGLSLAAVVNREIPLAEWEFQQAYDQARAASARLEIVFPTVGANQIEVFNLLVRMQPIIRDNQDIELAINPGICTRPDFYALLKKHGVKRYRNNMECSRRLFKVMVPQRPLAQQDKLRSLNLARNAGLKADTGWLCGLGEQETDILDIVTLLEACGPNSITINFFDPNESAEAFEHTVPSFETGLHRIHQLRDKFKDVEITLGGAYELWLGKNAAEIAGIDGVYVGRFLNHGLQEEGIIPVSNCH